MFRISFYVMLLALFVFASGLRLLTHGSSKGTETGSVDLHLLDSSMGSGIASVGSSQATSFPAGRALAWIRGHARPAGQAIRTMTSRAGQNPRHVLGRLLLYQLQRVGELHGLQLMEKWESVLKQPEKKRPAMIDAILGAYDRDGSPEYTDSNEDNLNREVLDAFEVMAKGVVHDDMAKHWETAAFGHVSESLVTSMKQADKFLNFLDEKDRRRQFLKVWSNRDAAPERQQRLAQLQFVLSVVEDTQAHFANTQAGNTNLVLGDWQNNLDARTQASNALRRLQGIMQNVVVLARQNNLQNAGVTSGEPDLAGPESRTLEQINKRLARDTEDALKIRNEAKYDNADLGFL